MFWASVTSEKLSREVRPIIRRASALSASGRMCGSNEGWQHKVYACYKSTQSSGQIDTKMCQES